VTIQLNIEMLPSFVHLNLAFKMTDDLIDSLPHDFQLNYVSVKSWDLGVDAPQNIALISIPSVVDPSVAPDGYIVLHAYAPATEDHALWAGLKPGTAEYESFKEERTAFLWDAIERIIPDARSRAVIKMSGSPLTHARYLRRKNGTYGPLTDAWKGGLGGAPDLLPGQKRTDIAEGFWCVGDGTFPGIGVPAVAASAWLAANALVDVEEQETVLRRIGLL
jgi:phytoene dehydrogenase-like protein